MVNKVILVGNLGQDVEVKHFEGGGKMARTSMATTERWKDKQSGEKREVTTWHNLTFHGALVDLADKYLGKGSKLYIEGKIVNRSWDKGDGTKGYSSEISVREIQFLSSKAEETAKSNHQSNQNQTTDDDEKDDLPF